MSNHSITLVTGATGKQGGATAHHLIRRGRRVRALTRNPDGAAARALRESGADVVKGDLDDRSSLDRALEGVDSVFSVQNFWETGYDKEIEQGLRLVDAAREAGVRHFVYASVASAHRQTGLSHFESKWKIEQYLRESGLDWTILRPVWFMENWEGPYLKPGVLSGTIAFPLEPGTNFQQVTVDDVGAVAALAFDDPEGWTGRALDLAGDERTITEVAAIFGRVIGRTVEYRQVDWEEYRKAAGDEYHDMFRWFQDVGYDADIAALRREYDSLTDFETYLRRGGWEGAEAAGS